MVSSQAERQSTLLTISPFRTHINMKMYSKVVLFKHLHSQAQNHTRTLMRTHTHTHTPDSHLAHLLHGSLAVSHHIQLVLWAWSETQSSILPCLIWCFLHSMLPFCQPHHWHSAPPLTGLRRCGRPLPFSSTKNSNSHHHWANNGNNSRLQLLCLLIGLSAHSLHSKGHGILWVASVNS